MNDRDLYKIYESQNLYLPHKGPHDAGVRGFVVLGILDHERSYETDAPRWGQDGPVFLGRGDTTSNRVADAKSKSKKRVVCSSCRGKLDQSKYSRNQWTKPAPRCKSCVHDECTAT
jgi:hypothetical protein